METITNAETLTLDDLERLEFLEIEKRIMPASAANTRLKFLKGAVKFLGMTDQEAFRYLKEQTKINNHRYLANKKTPNG